jgi:hypothetical protein
MKVLLHYFYVSAHKYVERMGAAATQKVPNLQSCTCTHDQIERFLVMARARFLSKGYDDG